jgi:hypothetical protein
MGCSCVFTPDADFMIFNRDCGMIRGWAATPLGLDGSGSFSQGSSEAATLGWKPESRWDTDRQISGVRAASVKRRSSVGQASVKRPSGVRPASVRRSQAARRRCAWAARFVPVFLASRAESNPHGFRYPLRAPSSLRSGGGGGVTPAASITALIASIVASDGLKFPGRNPCAMSRGVHPRLFF